MREVFWIDDEQQVGGRCGPETVAWDLADLRRQGIAAVLSVNEGTDCDPADFAAAGIAYQRVSFSAKAPPEPGDLEHNLAALPEAYTFIQTQVALGHKLIVHCRSGKDRTGLMLAYYLMRAKGMHREAALERLYARRPIALSAPDWDRFAPEVLRLALTD